AAVGAAALAGCRKDEPTPVVPPPTVTASQPGTSMPAPVLVAAISPTPVSLPNASDADNRIDSPQSSCSSCVTIYASRASDGPARRLTARWPPLDSDQPGAADSKAVAAGAQTTHFHIARPDGWPTGKYRLEVAQDGNVINTSEFEV